ncbi:MAG TPA: hypothetical protein VGB55_03875 [Tepidisphaeraceae bacterium]|jgi:uncharacterized protein YneF (UPF0154 family)
MHFIATVKAEDVFRSMSQPQDSPSGANYIILIVIGLIALLLIGSFFNGRKSAPRSGPAPANPHKLFKQLARQIGLKPREIKQLKQLAELEKLENPLVLLLCPSVLQAAASKRKTLRSGV